MINLRINDKGDGRLLVGTWTKEDFNQVMTILDREIMNYTKSFEQPELDDQCREGIMVVIRLYSELKRELVRFSYFDVENNEFKLLMYPEDIGLLLSIVVDKLARPMQNIDRYDYFEEYSNSGDVQIWRNRSKM